MKRSDVRTPEQAKAFVRILANSTRQAARKKFPAATPEQIEELVDASLKAVLDRMRGESNG